jgi:hypothetical protein
MAFLLWVFDNDSLLGMVSIMKEEIVVKAFGGFWHQWQTGS